ncbi:hypothetical protein QEN19_001284 [Hanseniaspora menglaensis]
MPTSLIHIKLSKNLGSVIDFINSITLSIVDEDDNNTEEVKGDYSLLLYKSKILDKYLTINYCQADNIMNVTAQDGESLQLRLPFQHVLDSKIVKQEFHSLLNSNKEWKFRQSFQMKHYSMGFYNDAVKVYKWDIYSDINDLLGIKLLVEYDTLANVKEFESVLKDVLNDGSQSEINLEAHHDLNTKNDISLKVLKMIL